MKVQVLGGGGWGIALARLLANAGHETALWVRNEMRARQLREQGEETRLLPGVKLPQSVDILTLPQGHADMVVYAIPSHALREIVEQYPFPASALRISTVKGIENDSLLRMSEIIAAAAPDAPVLALSGPSHAEEVGRDLPACVVIAGQDRDACALAQAAFGGPAFRVYTSDDIVGVELGGALKNIIAIAAGACDGFGLGDNAKAALITRGLAEMIRLGAACGASPETFAGLSGMGDLIVTCSSRHSRNHHVGYRIAQGRTLLEIARETPKVAEGVRTTKSAAALAARHGVDMPIAMAVHEVLFEDRDARACITALMSRLMKAEWT